MKEDPLGTRHIYEYDDRGREIHDRVTVIASSLDGTVRRISHTYDALDRVEKVTSWDNATVGSGAVKNEVEYEYGKWGVVETIWQDPDGAVVKTGGSPTQKVTYAYQFPSSGDKGMRVTSVTYPDTTKIHFVYNSGADDILSRLSGKKEDNSGSPGDWIFQDAYLGSGRLVEREYGDSSGSPVSTWTLVGTDSVNNDNYVGLDRMGRIDDLIIKDSSTNLNRYEYIYSYGGQVTWKKDRVGKIFGYDVFNEWNQYDDLGRITQRTRGDMNSGETDIPYPEQDEKWDWDTFGNLEKYCKTAAGTSHTCPNASYETSFLYNSSNEITAKDSDSSWPAYDKTGNHEAGGDTDRTFDAWNRLTKVTNTQPNPDVTLAEYEYNGLNQKIKRESSGSSLDDVFYYFGAGNQLLEEEKVTGGATLKCHVWGTQYIDDAVATADGSGTFTFLAHADQHNTVTEIDDAGSVLRRQLYHGFGLPTQVAANWLSYQTITEDKSLFTGRLYHLDHAAYDFRNRFEDPEIAVFSQRDPIGIWGDGVNFGNGYALVGGDPVNRSDPFGLEGFMGPATCAERDGKTITEEIERPFVKSRDFKMRVQQYFRKVCRRECLEHCSDGVCTYEWRDCWGWSPVADPQGIEFEDVPPPWIIGPHPGFVVVHGPLKCVCTCECLGTYYPWRDGGIVRFVEHDSPGDIQSQPRVFSTSSTQYDRSGQFRAILSHLGSRRRRN